jgi:hypothetical protein
LASKIEEFFPKMGNPLPTGDVFASGLLHNQSIRKGYFIFPSPGPLIASQNSMCGFPVYRINSNEKEPERVGSILEFRRSRRSMNRLGLAKLAQKLFAQGPGDIIIVGYDSSLERERIFWVHEIARSAG